MKITERLRLNTWISLGVVVILMALLVWSFREVSRADQNIRLIDEMQRAATERAFLRDDYLLNRNERAAVQWRAGSEILRVLLESASGRFTDAEDRALVREARKDFDVTYSLFPRILERLKQKGRPKGEKPDVNDAEVGLTNQLFLKSYALSDRFLELHRSARARVTTARENEIGLMALFIAGSVLAIIINSIHIRRVMLDRLVALNKGVEIIGTGGLDHCIDVVGDDELSDLARASNAMIEKLKVSYASTRDMEQEIAKRKEA